MSEHKISAVLEVKDNFSATIKTANKHLNEMGKIADKTKYKMKSAGTEIKQRFNATEKAAKSVRGAIKETGECIQAGISNLLKFNIAAMALRGLSAGFNFIKTAFKDFAEFDHILAKNGAIMRANKEDMVALKNQALELGKTMPFTAKEVAEAQKYQAMAGMKVNQILEMTPKLLKLSIASGEDLGRTSDILTDNMSAFGLGLEKADYFMDIMAATANNSNTSISELGEAYKYVAATSRSFDSLEEVNVILGILADNSIKGSIAGRNLAGIYARLAKTTPDMDKALKKIGVSLYNNSGKFKGLRNILEEIKPKLSKMTEEQRNYILTTLAGTEGLKIFSSILGYSAEGVEKVAGAVRNATGSMNEMYDRTKDTPENKIKALESAWDNLKLTIADKAAPAVIEIIDDLTKRIIDLADSDTFSKENVEAFFDAIRDGAKGALETLELIGFALKPIILGLKVLKKVGEWGANTGEFIGDKVEQDKISNKYLVDGYSPEEAEAKAKEDIKESKRVSKMSPSERKKYYNNKLKKQIEFDKEAEFIQIQANVKNNKLKYEGMQYSDYKKSDINKIINQNHQEKMEQKNINTKTINNQSTNNPENFNVAAPQISINFNGAVINNEDAIRKISREVGKEVQEKAEIELMKSLFNGWNVQT